MGETGQDEFARFTVLAADVRSLREAVDKAGVQGAHNRT